MKLLVEPIFKTIQVIWLDKLAGNICKNKKSVWLSLWKIRAWVTFVRISTNLVTTIWNWIKNGKTLGSIEVIFMPYVVHTVVVYFIVDSSN
jgi:hypothetical protein